MSRAIEEEKEPKEFFRPGFPKTRWYHKLLCKMRGGHDWRKFLWAWVDGPFDMDVCWNCYKCKGPLPNNRERPDWPARMNPY